MGNSSSKGAQAAGKAVSGAGKRQYPSTSSILNQATSTSNAPSHTSPPSQPPPATVHPSPSQALPSDTRSQHVDLDARDPHFASSLSRLGPIRRTPEASRPSPQSFPTSSHVPPSQQAPTGQNVFPSSNAAINPAIAIVNARDRLASKFQEESESVGRKGFAGRTLISAKEIREALRMRSEGRAEADIEKQLNLKSGLLSQILDGGMVRNV